MVFVVLFNGTTQSEGQKLERMSLPPLYCHYIVALLQQERDDKNRVSVSTAKVAYLAIDMNATSTPEFTFAEVSKNFIENSSASAFPFSNVTFYSSR